MDRRGSWTDRQALALARDEWHRENLGTKEKKSILSQSFSFFLLLTLQLPGSLDIDVLLPDAGIQTPRELVAWIDGDDVLHLEVVQGHEELRAEGAVVDVPRSEEERSQELEGHVVQLHGVADHLGQGLDHGGGATAFRADLEKEKRKADNIS